MATLDAVFSGRRSAMPNPVSRNSVILPEDFVVIEQTFLKICQAADVDLQSTTALILAVRTFAEFQNGHCSSEELLCSVALSQEYREAIVECGTTH
jgi:hypothetical protein